MNDLLGDDFDAKNIDNVLHVLRNPHGWNDHVVRKARLAAADEIERLRAAIANEREACAKVCEGLSAKWPIDDNHFDMCAHAIRERSNACLTAQKQPNTAACKT